MTMKNKSAYGARVSGPISALFVKLECGGWRERVDDSPLRRAAHQGQTGLWQPRRHHCVRSVQEQWGCRETVPDWSKGNLAAHQLRPCCSGSVIYADDWREDCNDLAEVDYRKRLCVDHGHGPASSSTGELTLTVLKAFGASRRHTRRVIDDEHTHFLAAAERMPIPLQSPPRHPLPYVPHIESRKSHLFLMTRSL